MADDGLAAYRRAFACDPLSAFGGVIALNRPVDVATAEALSQQFVEVLFAPAYEETALEILMRKPNVRILEDTERRDAGAEPRVTQVDGGLLVQDRDRIVPEREAMEVVTERAPTEEEWADLLFAWRVCRHVKSNAIVLARDGATAGIGAGQMSRVDSVRLAVEKCRLDSLEGAVMASDAFFPFADGPALALEAGVTRHHPARRLGARRRGRDRGQRGRRGDGPHEAAALPPLGRRADARRAPRLGCALGGNRRLQPRRPRRRPRPRRGHDGHDARRGDRRAGRPVPADPPGDRERRDARWPRWARRWPTSCARAST